MKELITAVKAARWYASNANNQYNEDNIELYDFAAQTLTSRQDFAAHLVRQLGDKPGRVLEIAAGTGLVSQEIHKNFPDTVYTDREKPALNILQKRLGEAAIVEADFYSMPFEDDSFDTVVGVGAYRYVSPDRKQEFWDEMHRVVSPSGKVMIAQFYPRFVGLRGNDISFESIPNFSLEHTDSYTSKINLGSLAVKSGHYKLYEYHPNQ